MIKKYFYNPQDDTLTIAEIENGEVTSIFELYDPHTVEDVEAEEEVVTIPTKRKGGRQKGAVSKCGNCGEIGHTKTTCTKNSETKTGKVLETEVSEVETPTAAETIGEKRPFVIPEHQETISKLVEAGNNDLAIHRHVHNHMTRKEVEEGIRIARGV